jgi:hypothetical protein
MKYLLFIFVFFYSVEAWVGGAVLGYSLSKDGLFLVVTGDQSLSVDYVDPHAGDTERSDLEAKGKSILIKLEPFFEKVRKKYPDNLSSWLYEKDAGKNLHLINVELGKTVNIQLAFVRLPPAKEIADLKEQLIKTYKSLK